MKTRDEKITSAISSEGFTYKGIFYRSLNTRMLLLLEKFKSPFYFGGDQLKGLMDFLFIASTPSQAVQSMTLSEFETAVYDFSDALTPEDLSELGRISNLSNEDSSATVVEIKEDSKNLKK